MPILAMTIYGGFDGGVQQLDHQHQNHRSNQQGHLNPIGAQIKSAGQEENEKPRLLLKRGFVPSGFEAFKRESEGVVDATKTTSFLLRIDGVSFFHSWIFIYAYDSFVMRR